MNQPFDSAASQYSTANMDRLLASLGGLPNTVDPGILGGSGANIPGSFGGAGAGLGSGGAGWATMLAALAPLIKQGGAKLGDWLFSGNGGGGYSQTAGAVPDSSYGTGATGQTPDSWGNNLFSSGGGLGGGGGAGLGGGTGAGAGGGTDLSGLWGNDYFGGYGGGW